MGRGLAVVLVVGGCGSGGGGTDAAAAPDAGVCTVPPGRSYVATGMNILPGDQGFDLDGDGVPDNEVAGPQRR